MIGVVLTAIAIGVGVWATRRWGDRDARLLFTYRTVPLLPSADVNGIIQVTYGDHNVQSPHLVTLRLQNTGSRDIPSDRFDSGKPLHIDLNSTIYGVVNSSPAAMRGEISTSSIRDASGYVKFAPALLRRSQEWSAEVLVSGTATPQLLSPLIDTVVVEAEAGSTTATAEFASIASAALANTSPSLLAHLLVQVVARLR